jgi:hypothetical protein
MLSAEPRRLILAGWALVIVLLILVLVDRGSEEIGFAVVAGSIAAALAAWIWFRGRASLIVTLVVGALWLLLFVGYAIAAVTGDEFDAVTFVGDLLGVVAGLAIVWGVIRAFRVARVRRTAG